MVRVIVVCGAHTWLMTEYGGSFVVCGALLCSCIRVAVCEGEEKSERARRRARETTCLIKEFVKHTIIENLFKRPLFTPQ